MKLFVDTSAFLALEDEDDGRHREALEFFRSLSEGDRLQTSNYVVDETITRLRYTVGAAAAIRFAEASLASRACPVAYVDADLERAAIEVLRRYRDKKLSFTDCTTVALVRARRLDGVFAFDEDFVKVGLKAFP